ncbi:MAG: tyrosine-type recombinase/integrase [Actinomycetota bacterium]|nr:tyrosine-type recombinase/integrase [Actinomycetota bacterium]
MFVGLKGAQQAHSNFHTIWDKARQRVSMPNLHLHDLRHTGNTLAAETGATLRELMEGMGHRSTRAALIYLHARDQRDMAITDGLDAIVGTAGIGSQQTVSSRKEGDAGGKKRRQPSVKRPQSTDNEPSTSKNRRSGRRESNPHSQLGSSVLHPQADLRIVDQRVESLPHRHSPLFPATACPIWHGSGTTQPKQRRTTGLHLNPDLCRYNCAKCVPNGTE